MALSLRERLRRLQLTANSPRPSEPGTDDAPVKDSGGDQEGLASRLEARWEPDGAGTLVVDRLYADNDCHAGVELGEYLSLDPLALRLLAGDENGFQCFQPSRTLFLDTETTGLSGGAGTYVFLVGTGFFHGSRFVVRQFLLPALNAERAHLMAIEDLVRRKNFERLVTFNGKSFDLTVLRDRYLLHRLEPSVLHLEHLDLLHPSRLLWGRRLDNCSLQQLEQSVLNFRREHDIPSALIPRVFFEFLRTGRTGRLRDVLHHNRLDLLSMLSLCCAGVSMLSGNGEKSPVDSLALYRFYRRRGDRIQALRCLQQCVSDLPPGPRRCHLRHELAELLRKSGRNGEALEIYLELISNWSHPPASIFEGAAMILEHFKKDFSAALEIVEMARRHHCDPALDRRYHRLHCRRQGKRWY